MTKKSPAPVGARGKGTPTWHSVYTLPPLATQTEFYPVAWIARRAGVNLATARLFVELNSFGGGHGRL